MTTQNANDEEIPTIILAIDFLSKQTNADGTPKYSAEDVEVATVHSMMWVVTVLPFAKMSLATKQLLQDTYATIGVGPDGTPETIQACLVEYFKAHPVPQNLLEDIQKALERFVANQAKHAETQARKMSGAKANAPRLGEKAPEGSEKAGDVVRKGMGGKVRM